MSVDCVLKGSGSKHNTYFRTCSIHDEERSENPRQTFHLTSPSERNVNHTPPASNGLYTGVAVGWGAACTRKGPFSQRKFQTNMCPTAPCTLLRLASEETSVNISKTCVRT